MRIENHTGMFHPPENQGLPTYGTTDISANIKNRQPHITATVGQFVVGEAV
jgi:hypothetical protein